jgi:cyanophycinase-like exopeptidase
MAEREGSSGRLTLIGSGELAPSMSRVHRAVAARLVDGPRAVFVDTPAGFEPNVDDIGAKAIAYFDRHLGIACDVATFRHAASATQLQTDAAVRRIRLANYVFAGPGSPTFAVKNWRGTPVFDAIAERLTAGAEVVLASAAAIASSAFALPIYEIYKAGDDLSWLEGCDLLATRGFRLAIVPHWNNAEGGGFDTRFCYMGHERFERLRAMLDPTVVILGLDEYTAASLDFAAGSAEVMGAGAVTILNNGTQREFGAGETFSLDLLRTGPRGDRQGETQPEPPAAKPEVGVKGDLARRVDAARRMPLDPRGRPALVAAIMLDLAEAIEQSNGRDDEQLAQARDALGEVVSTWCESLEDAGGKDDVGPFVDLLIDARRELRAQKAFAAADAIREGLASRGVMLEDSKEGTSWRR